MTMTTKIKEHWMKRLTSAAFDAVIQAKWKFRESEKRTVDVAELLASLVMNGLS